MGGKNTKKRIPSGVINIRNHSGACCVHTHETSASAKKIRIDMLGESGATGLQELNTLGLVVLILGVFPVNQCLARCLQLAPPGSPRPMGADGRGVKGRCKPC